MSGIAKPASPKQFAPAIRAMMSGRSARGHYARCESLAWCGVRGSHDVLFG